MSCKHEFVDSNRCVKCNWIWPIMVPGPLNNQSELYRAFEWLRAEAIKGNEDAMRAVDEWCRLKIRYEGPPDNPEIVCAFCKWTNVNLLNVGEPNGTPKLICHSCTKKAVDTLDAVAGSLKKAGVLLLLLLVCAGCQSIRQRQNDKWNADHQWIDWPKS